MARVPVECPSIDRILGGGIETSAVTQLFGEGGSGKSNICLQVTRNVIRSSQKVIYIDTEGASMERFSQICGGEEEYKKYSREALFFQPMNSVQLRDAVKSTLKLANRDLHIGLIVLDSATVFYRVSLGSGRDEENRREISQIIMDLMEVSRKQDIPILITTQVYSSSGPGEVRPIGGHSLAHNCKAIIRLEKIGERGFRKAVMVKHRSMPTGENALFKLTGSGVEDLDEDETDLVMADTMRIRV